VGGRKTLRLRLPASHSLRDGYLWGGKGEGKSPGIDKKSGGNDLEKGVSGGSVFTR